MIGYSSGKLGTVTKLILLIYNLSIKEIIIKICGLYGLKPRIQPFSTLVHKWPSCIKVNLYINEYDVER